MSKWDQLADDATIAKTIAALAANGFDAEVVETLEDAKERVLELIPKGAEIMNNTSLTMDTIGVTKEVLESGKYNPVRITLMDPNADPRLKKKLGAAAEYSIGSVHAVTQDGHVLMASGSGSQIPGYAYGSDHVIWAVGTQKIVKDTQEGIKRIYEHSLPLENERAKKAYGVGSAVRRLLIFNEEKVPQRIHLIFVKQSLGF